MGIFGRFRHRSGDSSSMARGDSSSLVPSSRAAGAMDGTRDFNSTYHPSPMAEGAMRKVMAAGGKVYDKSNGPSGFHPLIEAGMRRDSEVNSANTPSWMKPDGGRGSGSKDSGYQEGYDSSIKEHLGY